jgi:hypothetical protein
MIGAYQAAMQTCYANVENTALPADAPAPPCTVRSMAALATCYTIKGCQSVRSNLHMILLLARDC